MDTENILYSPVICYEISGSENGYQVDVYLQGHKNCTDPRLHCTLTDFSENEKLTRKFIGYLSASCALPVHIPEIAEEYLSANFQSDLLFQSDY